MSLKTISCNNEFFYLWRQNFKHNFWSTLSPQEFGNNRYISKIHIIFSTTRQACGPLY